MMKDLMDKRPSTAAQVFREKIIYPRMAIQDLTTVMEDCEVWNEVVRHVAAGGAEG